MDSSQKSGEMAININETKSAEIKPTKSKSAKGKSAALGPPVIVATTKATGGSKGGWKRGVGIFDFILRIAAIGAALAATATMGTTDQTLPFFTQFLQFQASYDDLPAFTYFVIANGVASAYLVLSLPFSIVCIVRPHVVGARLLLLILDTVMVALTTSGAAAAASIVYLAHNGNPNTNWNAICQQFNDFCQRVSGAVVASFITALIFVFLVVLSAVALRRN